MCTHPLDLEEGDVASKRDKKRKERRGPYVLSVDTSVNAVDSSVNAVDRAPVLPVDSLEADQGNNRGLVRLSLHHDYTVPLQAVQHPAFHFSAGAHLL
jgi:hypothetical protein